MFLILDTSHHSTTSHTLGRSLHAALQDTHAVDRAVIDYGRLSDRPALAGIIDGYHPSHIISCIEFSDVDGAEYDRETAYAVNSFAARTLAELCRERNVLMVNPGTCSVFSGCAGIPVAEDAPHDPVNVFGDSRSLGEALVAESGCRHLTVRFPYVYGDGIPLFNHGLALTDVGGRLVVHGGQVIAPISSTAAAAALAALITAGATGTFHVGPQGSTPAAAFIGKAVDLLHGMGRIREKIDITEVAGDEFLAPADRPLYNVLDTGKYSSFTGVQTSRWEAALEDYIRSNHESLQITGKEHVK